jgi:hypothetical protein
MEDIDPSHQARWMGYVVRGLRFWPYFHDKAGLYTEAARPWNS